MINLTVTRESSVAGSWYEGDNITLQNQIEQLFLNSRFGPGSLPPSKSISAKETQSSFDAQPNLLGVIVPHAGYKYSGYTAAHAYHYMKKSMPELDTAIIIGPNHRGIGPDISISNATAWQTPLGITELDVNLIDQIISFYQKKGESLKSNQDKLPEIIRDDNAHVSEHSLEMQLPILQYLYGDQLKIVPICLKDQSYHASKLLAEVLYNALSQSKNSSDKKFTIVASTDLSHEYDQRLLKQNDETIRDAISTGILDNFHKTRQQTGITMCGYGSVYSIMHFLDLEIENKEHSGRIIELDYTHSGQITSRSSGYTVGYLAAASIIT